MNLSYNPALEDLPKYVVEHTTRYYPEQSAPSVEALDLTFFKVSINTPDGGEAPTAEKLRELISKHEGHHNDMNPFDGKEHSYLEVGGWVGDQGIALSLIALGHLLGLWKCLSPETVMPFLPSELKKEMAGQGFISLSAIPAVV